MLTETKTPARTSKEQFDRQAAHYDRQWNSWSEETLAWMLDTASPKPGDRVLDVATGGGFTAIEFAKRGAKVAACDVSSGMLMEAARRAADSGVAVEFLESPAEALPSSDAQFDFVTCRIAAHHFLDAPGFAAEAFRVLRPGGHLVLVDTTVPNDDPAAAAWQNGVEAVRDPSHARNYSPAEWRTMLEKAGFAIETISDYGAGITIPLDDWIHKAGCDEAQAADVRGRFAEAPDAAKAAFKIVSDADGKITFTWKRVLIKAVKA